MVSAAVAPERAELFLLVDAALELLRSARVRQRRHRTIHTLHIARKLRIPRKN
jgi:hypothetical protein